MSWRGGSPKGRESTETSAVTAIPAILVLLALGLALRFIIAYVLLPGSGFPNDLGAFQFWGNDIAAHGPIGFYDRTGFIDYPPVYLLLLSVVSLLVGGSLGEGVKVLPILADLALAGVVWIMVLELGGSGRRALIAAAIILFNPVTWFNSAIWGQADAVGAIFLLLGLRELQRDRRETASVLAVLAVLTKMQLGILGFLVGFVVLRRSLAPRTGKADPIRILTSIGAGLATVALVCLPFTGLDFLGLANRISSVSGLFTVAAGLVAGLGVFALARRYLPLEEARRTLVSALLGAGTAVVFAGMVFDSIVSHLLNTFGEYPYLTLNAYNPWALVTTGSGDAMDRGLSWIRDAPFTDPKTGITDPGFVIGPFSATVVAAALGLVVLLAAGAAVAWQRSRAIDRATAEEVSGSYPATDRAGTAPVASRDWASELRGVAGICVVAAASITFVVGGQLIAPLWPAVVGDGFLLAILLGVGAWAAWRDDRLSLLVGLTILSIAFFVVPTRAHERYLFPFFGLGAILLSMSWRWSVAYVLLAAVNSVNLLAVLVEYKGIPAGDGAIAGTLIDWGVGIVNARWFDGIIWLIALSAVVTGLGLIWALLQMRGVSVDRLAREAAAAGEVPPGLGETATNDIAAGQAAAGGVATAAMMAGVGPHEASGGPHRAEGREESNAADEPDAGDEPNDWIEEDYLDEGERPDLVPAWLMSIWRRLFQRSSMPDRSASLNAEPRGRLDKLDLWVVVALAVAILSLRVYRLDEPLQMHFDEVYHARTATEFLQDWRYNIPYNLPGGYVYEWTHPHVAKYAIAGGIVLFSDDKVTSTGQLGVDVVDVLVQPRLPVSPLADASKPNDPRSNSDARFGDRAFIATGSEVRVYDLESRALVQTYSIPGASSLSTPGTTGVIYVGTTQGRIWRIDANSLDDVRLGLAATSQPATQLDVQTDLSIAHLYAGTPPLILAADANGNVVSVDLTQSGGAVVARAVIPGAADFADLGTGPAILTRTSAPASTQTPGSSSAEAGELASALGLDISIIDKALSTTAAPGLDQGLDLGPLSSDQETAVQALLAQGKLPGFAVSSSDPQVMVAYADGIGVLNGRHLVLTSTVNTDQPATSIAINPNQNQDSYVAAGDSLVLIKTDASAGSGSITKDPNQPLRKMPGSVSRVVYDNATKIVQVLGRTPDGQGWTVYSVESNGNAVFSDARLPFQPVAIGLDSSPQLPDSDREQLLAFSPNGSVASVDVGQFAFSWRIIGVAFGALMAVCLYLLARILFRRRSVGLLVALFSLADGMLFAQSRIAMNDTYVGGFLLLAYLLFALIWLRVWKGRFAFWLGMPLLGVVLGLALASKWVGLYALASIGVLILIRSALGRVIVILGLAAGTGIFGWKAIGEMITEPNSGNPGAVILLLLLGVAVVVGGAIWALSARTTPDKVLIGAGTTLIAALALGAALVMSPGAVQNGAPNYTFFIIMLAVTMVAAAVNAYHPIAWTREELVFAIAAPIGIGLLAGILGVARSSGLLIEIGAAGLVAGIGAAIAFWVGGQMGFGPLAVPRSPDDPASFVDPPAPAPTGWLRLGSGWGLPAFWMSLCLLVLPFVVYIVMYIPWAMPWQPQTNDTGQLPVIACLHTDAATGVCDQALPAGHTGQTLWDLTISMYNYHNDLRSPHAASSPWWAWPMDLKPVWFESIGYANDQGSMIYDGGNPALWWMAIFAMAFLFWQAFKRRSLGLALIAVAFLWQWLSWARIDRAAFQYHFYTALPFFLLALAYFLAELWHGPSRRTWLLARVAAAAALLFPTAVWALKSPLCGLARVSTSDYFGNTACGTSTGDVRVDIRIFLIGAVLVGALAVLALVLLRLERRQARGEEDRAWVLQLLAPVAIAGVLLLWLGQNAPQDTLFEAALPSDLIILVLLPILAVLAAIALNAQNPRRFVLGVCSVAVVAFIALYPNLSALPMPNAIIGVYNGLLPTWLYGFQFSVNQQVSASIPLVDATSLSYTALALAVAGIAGWAAWERRVVLGYRRAGRPGSGAAQAAELGAGTAADESGDAAGEFGEAAAGTSGDSSGPAPTA
ncbi:MAG TPA: phospholipid carrier-dependent glycosyltransferase [Candidatus Limnocylindrales bacterium]